MEQVTGPQDHSLSGPRAIGEVSPGATPVAAAGGGVNLQDGAGSPVVTVGF